MSIKNVQTGKKDLTEKETQQAIAKMDALYRLDPIFPYVLKPFPWNELGVDAVGVDIPFSDTTLQ